MSVPAPALIHRAGYSQDTWLRFVELLEAYGLLPWSIPSDPLNPGPNSLSLVDLTGGSATVTLPGSIAFPGTLMLVKIKGLGGGNGITVTSDNGALIDGQASQVLANDYEFMVMIYDGAAWWIIG